MAGEGRCPQHSEGIAYQSHRRRTRRVTTNWADGPMSEKGPGQKNSDWCGDRWGRVQPYSLVLHHRIFSLTQGGITDPDHTVQEGW